MTNAAGGTGMKVQIDWRRGPREMKKALDRTREAMLKTMERQIRKNAPPGVKQTITRTAAQVVIAHSAALFIELGTPAGTMPPLDGLREWAKSVGKDPHDAFAVARHIKQQGIPARPFIQPAIELALSQVDDEFRKIWEGERR